MESCDHEDDIISCEFCSHEYCDMCENFTCEWCRHNRSEQVKCPECCGTVDEFGQTICFMCFYFDIDDEKIFYDLDAEEFIYYDDTEGRKNIIKDKEVLLKLAYDKYPKLKRLYEPNLTLKSIRNM